jgi:hypothetical protein
MKTTTAIRPGTEFRAAYADANALWRVIKSVGRGAWLCEIVNEPIEIDGKVYDGDYTGTQKAFLTREIQGSIGMAKLFKGYEDEGDAFYASLFPGQIVHYDNGFNAYVRCEVTHDHELKPVALVGEWRDFDLPRRMADGSVYLGYYVEHIKEGKTFHPNASNIYEFRMQKNSGGWTNEKHIDPRNLAPLSLEVPKLNPAEARKAKLIKGIYAIHEMTSSVDDNPNELLKQIAEKVLETLRN